MKARKHLLSTIDAPDERKSYLQPYFSFTAGGRCPEKQCLAVIGAGETFSGKRAGVRRGLGAPGVQHSLQLSAALYNSQGYVA